MSDLYRFYDANGTLLYVGQSSNAGMRATQHRNSKHWYTKVDLMTRRSFSRDEIDQAEVDAIQSEHPIYNVKYAGGKLRLAFRRAQYEVGLPPTNALALNMTTSGQRFRLGEATSCDLRIFSCHEGRFGREREASAATWLANLIDQRGVSVLAQMYASQVAV